LLGWRPKERSPPLAPGPLVFTVDRSYFLPCSHRRPRRPASRRKQGRKRAPLFCRLRPSSPRRRCRCSRRRPACGLRSQSTCRHARCSSCTPPCCTISNLHNLWSLALTSCINMAKLHNRVAPPVFAVGHLHDAPTHLQRGNALYTCGEQQFSTNLLHTGVQRACAGVMSAGMCTCWHMRRGLRRVLQRSRHQRRRSADRAMRERRRRFSKSGILAVSRPGARAASPGRCYSRAATTSSRCAHISNPAHQSAHTRADSALFDHGPPQQETADPTRHRHPLKVRPRVCAYVSVYVHVCVCV
jgi:hypothetical protein